MAQTPDVVFVDGVRTPFGRAGEKGQYWNTRADDLIVKAMIGLLERNPNLPKDRVDDVAIAATTQQGDQGLTLGRTSAILAGLPMSVPGYAVDRMCAGAMTTVTTIAGAIAFGAYDIGIAGGRIAALGSFAASEAAEIVDCRGLHILPGVIDTQVHFREPGLTHKEDLESGSRSAVMGGVTAVFEMPNTDPLTVTAEAFSDKIKRAHHRMHCDFAFFIGGTHDNVKDLPELERAPGCAGVKVFIGSSTGSLRGPRTSSHRPGTCCSGTPPPPNCSPTTERWPRQNATSCAYCSCVPNPAGASRTGSRRRNSPLPRSVRSWSAGGIARGARPRSSANSPRRPLSSARCGS